MNKQIRSFKIDHELEWTYGVEIKKIKEDLIELEKLGATHINIEAESGYEGSCFVSIEVFTERLETDSEFESRINKEKRMRDEMEQRERAEWQKLKEKYGTGDK